MSRPNQRVNEIVLQKMMRNIMIYDAGCIPQATCHVNPSPFAMPPSVWHAASQYVLNHVIGKKRLTWQLWTCLFDLSPDGERTFKSGVIRDVVIETDHHLADKVADAIREFMEAEETEFTVTNAWVAVPSAEVDIQANEPAFVEMFEKLGVWNVEQCRRMSTARALERRARSGSDGAGDGGNI